MSLPQNNVATYDSGFAKTEVLADLIKTAQEYAPLLTDHMDSESSTASRIEWGDQALYGNKVTLAAAYTAGSGTMTFGVSTLAQPFTLVSGISEVYTTSGGAIFPITAFNTATGVATLGTVIGTDASIATAIDMFIGRASPQGENAGAQNDVQFATFDYNYLSNFSYTIRIGNMDKKGQLQYYVNEITFDNQLQNNIPNAINTLEWRAWKDVRTAGTGAATRNGNTIQSGNNSRAGGVLSLGAARSMYSATTAASLSEDLLNTDIGTIDDRGAFNKPFDRTRNMGTKYCSIYCHPTFLGTFNKMTRLQRSRQTFYGPEEKMGGTAGSYANTFLADRGVVCELKPTLGLAPGEIFYLPRKDLIKVRVVRLLEEQPEIPGGDNSIRMYSCTYSVIFESPRITGYRSNIAS